MPTVKRSGRQAFETVWCNFPSPVELHDYRYLGQNFRERERIKKKTRRWRQKLSSMPALERSCLMHALSQLASPETASRTGTPELAMVDR